MRKSDGCTGWPDSFRGIDYFDCCVEHDNAYFLGGSWLDRVKADWRLSKCVGKKGAKFMAPIMFIGVRFCGFLFFKYKWAK